MGEWCQIKVKWPALLLVTLIVQIIWASQPIAAGAMIYFDMAIDESRRRIYGSDRDGGKIDIVSMDTLRIVDSVKVGSQPAGLDISPDYSELAVALSGQSQIAFVNLKTLEVTARLVPQGTLGPNRPYDLLYGRPGRLYSVGSPGSSGVDYVHTYDTVDKVEVGRSAEIMRAAPRLAMTADRNTLYVSSVIFSPQKIYRFDISTDTPVQNADAPHGPVNVNTLAVKPDGSRVYSSRGQVWSADLATLLSDVVFSGQEIEYSDTLQRFFITEDSEIKGYDANSYTLMRRYQLQKRTGGVAKVGAAGTILYVSTDSGIVSVDLETGDIITGDQEFPWAIFMPAIVSRGCQTGPVWGAYTQVCCRGSSLTFSITVLGETKQSTAASCAVEPTWSDWQDSSAGRNSVYWRIKTGACGVYSGRFSWEMSSGEYYFFQLELVNGVPTIFVYAGDTCDLVQNTQTTRSQSLPEKSSFMGGSLLQKVKEIKLDLPWDVLKPYAAPAEFF